MSNQPIKITATVSARCTLFDRIEDDVKMLTGELLTLVDASFSDPEQRKAFKDCVRAKIKNFHQDELNRSVFEVFDLLAPKIGDNASDQGYPPSYKTEKLRLNIDYEYTRSNAGGDSK